MSSVPSASDIVNETWENPTTTAVGYPVVARAFQRGFIVKMPGENMETTYPPAGWARIDPPGQPDPIFYEF